MSTVSTHLQALAEIRTQQHWIAIGAGCIAFGVDFHSLRFVPFTIASKADCCINCSLIPAAGCIEKKVFVSREKKQA